MFIEQAAGIRNIQAALLASMRRHTADWRALRMRKQRGEDIRLQVDALQKREADLFAVLEHCGLRSSKSTKTSPTGQTIERRSLDTTLLLHHDDMLRKLVTTRSDSPAIAPPPLSGYAAVFGERFNASDFIETISSTAFDSSLKSGQRIVSTYNHNDDLPLGATPKTLSLSVDRRGLWMRVHPPNTSFGQGIVESVRRGDITGQSFTFVTKRDKWEMKDGKPFRTLEDLLLLEAGPVLFPAYQATTILVDDGQRTMKEIGTSRTSKPSDKNREPSAKTYSISDCRRKIRETELKAKGVPLNDTYRRRLQLAELEAKC